MVASGLAPVTTGQPGLVPVFASASRPAAGADGNHLMLLGALLFDAVRGHALMDALLLGSGHRPQPRSAPGGCCPVTVLDPVVVAA